jgi:hypothetical protein
MDLWEDLVCHVAIVPLGVHSLILGSQWAPVCRYF